MGGVGINEEIILIYFDSNGVNHKQTAFMR